MANTEVVDSEVVSGRNEPLPNSSNNNVNENLTNDEVINSDNVNNQVLQINNDEVTSDKVVQAINRQAVVSSTAPPTGVHDNSISPAGNVNSKNANRH